MSPTSPGDARFLTRPIEPVPDPTGSRKAISDACDQMKDFLLEKNLAYGDSALNPVRMFSGADPVEQIKVRIDDKLSRIRRGQAMGEDVIKDLAGYLILLLIARTRAE